MSILTWFLDNDNGTEVCVEVVNTKKEFKWRLVVNSDASEWSQHYAGILVHKDYAIATDYWNGWFPVMKPFKVKELKPISGISKG